MFNRSASAALDGPATVRETTTAVTLRSQARCSAAASDQPPVAASSCRTTSPCGVHRRSRSKVSASTTCSTRRDASARYSPSAPASGGMRINRRA